MPRSERSPLFRLNISSSTKTTVVKSPFVSFHRRIAPPNPGRLIASSHNRGDMNGDTARRLFTIAVFSSFASTAAAQTPSSLAPTPDVTAPLREEVQRLQKEVESLKARLRECSSGQAASAAPVAQAAPTALVAPVAPPEIAEFRYQEALAAAKAIEPTIGGSYSEFHRRYVVAKMKVDGLSGSTPREEGLRKVMSIFKEADYKLSLGNGNPGFYATQTGIELSVRAQAALASLVAAQAQPATPTPTAR
jgi:hypothetical protein